MAQIIGAVGVPLPPPLSLYPVTTSVPPIPNIAATNAISLNPGGALLIPSGTFFISPGQYSTIQVQDPVSQVWTSINGYGTGDPSTIVSDGQNYRVYNPTGFPIGAVVNVSGSGYTSNPAVAAATGGSTWVAVLGPSVAALACPSTSTNASGVGYGIPPLISIAAPATPGVQATAICAISGGAISGFTIINAGGPYPSPPTVVAIPHPFDPNFSATSTTRTVSATVVAQTSYAGQVAAVLLTNQGVSVASVPPALTITGGGGSGAVATAVLAQSVTAVAITSGGTGFAASGAITSAGGSIYTQTSGVGSLQNPIVNLELLNPPRQCMFSATNGSGTGVQVGTLIDGGIFTAPPVLYAVPPGTGVFTATPTMGGQTDTIYITPL